MRTKTIRGAILVKIEHFYAWNASFQGYFTEVSFDASEENQLSFCQNLRFRPVKHLKWQSEPKFCERWTYIWRKMARNYWFMRNIHFESVFSSKMSTFAHFHPHLLNNKNIKTLFPQKNLNPLFSKDILNPIFAYKKCFIKLNLFFTLFF